MWSSSAGTGNWEMKWWHNKKKKVHFWINKCSVYVTWPFPSLVQTTERQGTTSQQHGCRDPRLKPLELLGPNGRNKTLQMRLPRKVVFFFVHERWKRDAFLFFREEKKRTFEAQLQKWVMGAEACKKGSTVVSLHAINHQQCFTPQEASPHSSPMYCIVPQMVNARPPRFSRRESPKSDKRRWPGWKHTLSGSSTHHVQKDNISSSLPVLISAWNCALFFFYLDHLQAHFPSKNTQKQKNVVIFLKRYIP